MKIALISPLPPPEGGIATWTKEATSYFADNAIQFKLINNAVVGKRKDRITAATSVRDELVRTNRILKELKATLDSFEPDLLHINTSCGRFGIYRDYLCILIAKKKSIPCILHCHCNVRDQLHSSFAEYIFKLMVQMSAEVLVLNRSTQEYVKQHTQHDSILVPNFIDTHGKEEINKMIKDSMQDVLFVGHIQKTKGCNEIIETARRCPKIRFTLVGPIGSEYDQLNFPSNVRTVGKKKHAEVEEYMHEADVFLFPSYTEGFSNALLEAMMNGLPVVASDVGANRDMLEDKGGIIIPIQDVDAIVCALDLLEKVEIRKSMSDWNVRKVRNSYTKGYVMGRITDIYRKTLIRG